MLGSQASGGRILNRLGSQPTGGMILNRAGSRPGGSSILNGQPGQQIPSYGVSQGTSSGSSGGVNIGQGGGYNIGGSQGTSVQGSRQGSQQGTYIVPGMQGLYQNLLGMNQGVYQQALDAYGQGQQNLGQQLPRIYGGYQGVLGGVQGALQQQGQIGEEAIQREFAQRQGATDQQMIGSGLGNTTIRGNMQNQNSLMQGQAIGGLYANLAQQSAQAQQQVGLAGQAAQLQGLGMQTGLSQAQGGSLLGHQFSNTLGNLTGGYGSSFGQSFGQSQNSAYNQGQNWNNSFGMNFGNNQSQNTGYNLGGYSLPDASGGYGSAPGNRPPYSFGGQAPGLGGAQQAAGGFQDIGGGFQQLFGGGS